MSRRSFTDPRLLLGDLLTRYEANPGARRLLAYVDDASFLSVSEQDQFMAALADMAERRAVELSFRQIDGIRRLVSVRLSDALAAYAWLGRTPSAQRAKDALSQLPSSDDALQQLITAEIEAGWARNVRVFGLRPGQSAELSKVLDLTRALIRRAEGAAAPQVDVRTFSRSACGDSKTLRDNASSVIAIMRRLRPELLSDAAVEPAEMLATWGVIAMPHPLLISGTLALDAVVLPRTDFVGLPTEDAGRLRLPHPPAYVLTVENQASFVRHAREVNQTGEALIIYTGGFPSRSILRAIVDLCSCAGAPTFHWGDLDAGGVRIFLHLEEALATAGITLRPHMMEAGRVLAKGTDLGRGRVVSVPSSSAIADVAPLIAGPGYLSLEQEAVTPTRPLLSGPD